MSADLICVLHEGKMIEIGNHEELLEQKGAYYDLVKQQMWFKFPATISTVTMSHKAWTRKFSYKSLKSKCTNSWP